jgi:UDP:flavonoid glycosyltransferase YjiC (YdhE family)
METEKFFAPPNVKLIANASHAQVFTHADCVICHGGHGTVMRALANGLPIVCMPMGRDQDDNAAKLVLHHLGIKISPKANVAKISKAISKILNNPSYKQNAQAKGAQIVQDSKKDILVDALENIRNR